MYLSDTAKAVAMLSAGHHVWTDAPARYDTKSVHHVSSMRQARTDHGVAKGGV